MVAVVGGGGRYGLVMVEVCGLEVVSSVYGA
jgi:hypothetical protein